MRVVLDIETTGLDKYKGDILQVCMYNIDTKESFIRTYHSEFSYEQSKGAIEINGLTDEVITEIRNKEKTKYPRLFKEDISFWGDLLKDIKKIIAHNIKFDSEWLIHNGVDLLGKELICTQKLMQKYKPKKGWWKLKDAINYFYQEFYNAELAHRADYDVEVCLKLYEKLI